MTSEVYYNDNDAYCCKVLRANIDRGNLPQGYVDERDIRLVSAADIERYTHVHLFAGVGAFPLGLARANWPTNLRTLTGGFPCQDISNAGKQEGITGARSGLWKEIVRLIVESLDSGCGFDIVLLENVSALTSRGLDTVLIDLAQAGFDAEWQCLRASDVAAPHQRERIFIVAYPSGVGSGTRWATSEEQRQEWCSADTDSDGTPDVAHANSDSRRRSQRTVTGSLASPSGTDLEGEGHSQRDANQCGGETLGHADGPQRRPSPKGWEDVSDGDDARWQEATSGPQLSSQELAYPDGSGCEELDATPKPGELGYASWRNLAPGSQEPIVESSTIGRERQYQGAGRPQGTQYLIEQPGTRSTESGMGRSADGAAHWLDRYQWPTGPGEAQHDWEPARVTTERLIHRVARLKALGNAVVPQCVEYVARQILATLY